MHCCAVVVNTSTEIPLKLCLLENYFKKKKKTIKTHLQSDYNFGFQKENLCDSLMINMALIGKALSKDPAVNILIIGVYCSLNKMNKCNVTTQDIL